MIRCKFCKSIFEPSSSTNIICSRTCKQRYENFMANKRWIDKLIIQKKRRIPEGYLYLSIKHKEQLTNDGEEQDLYG